ncbi:inner membrane-spanning protein YciB [Thioclava litoralis]|uniref:Inner membrane-spanning protein YciB n=1 Tax=Thioclava litoralis TaxID=3076557 RepID=A0ABZ1DZ05_9RHOB|nr:inner membrane-spanning protein YciB [Thioclava sp. FTW29]
MSERKISPVVKGALEWGPILAFFVVYMKLKDQTVMFHGTEYHGFIVATAMFIPLLTICTLILWKLTGKLAPMQIATLVLVIVFGGLSVWLNDPKFFKMKVTLIYLLFAGILGAGLLLGKPWLQLVLSDNLPMKPEGWTILTKRLALFFLGLAVLNEVIWRTQSEEMWVNFKTFGLMILMFVFLMAQGGLLKRYALEESAEDKTDD